MPKKRLQYALICAAKKLKAMRLWPPLKNEITVVFVTPQKMKNLNTTYRKKTYVTDVLSFHGTNESFGELVLCPSKIISQAKIVGHGYQNELDFLIIHGLLHLLGYEHESSDKDATKMYRLQDQLVRTLNRKTRAQNDHRDRTRRYKKKSARHRS